MNHVILSIVVGAIIGLFTNWIAIVMLFRPHKEMRVFGKRVPMTPGLIPRRQEDLADKLGEVVQEDLLTPEGLAKSIKRPAVEFAVKQAAVRSIGDTLNEAPTVGALAERSFGSGTTLRSERWLTEQAVTFLRSEGGRERLMQLADSLFDHLRGSLSQAELRGELARGFAQPLHAHLTGGTLSWQDALPESARAVIEERLRAQVGPFLGGASQWMQSPAVVEAISSMLQEKVEGIPLIGPMAKSFLTPERVAADIVPRLQSVIQSGRTVSLVEDKLQDAVREFWNNPVGRYLGQLSADDMSSVIGNILGVIAERVLSEDGSSREMFRSFIVDGLLAGANEKTVGDLVHRIVSAVAAYDLRAVYIERTEAADRLVSAAWRFLRDKLIDSMPELLDALAIRQVVRDQVASYPIPTLERLILTVVNKELRLITILGGVLGAVIGAMQAFLATI